MNSLSSQSGSLNRAVARRKQGGSQSINDNSKGNAKSAGAQLRRYGEQALRDVSLAVIYHACRFNVLMRTQRISGILSRSGLMIYLKASVFGFVLAAPIARYSSIMTEQLSQKGTTGFVRSHSRHGDR